MIERLCKNCGKSFHRYNSFQTICGLCVYNKNTKPRKPLKKIGPITKKWIEARNTWIQNNPADIYTCYICRNITITLDELTLDHVKSRSRYPELRFEQSNLKPCCRKCNEIKGSRDLSEMKEEIEKQQHMNRTGERI